MKIIFEIEEMKEMLKNSLPKQLGIEGMEINEIQFDTYPGKHFTISFEKKLEEK